MRTWKTSLLCLFALAAGSVVLLSFTRGQQGSSPSRPTPSELTTVSSGEQCARRAITGFTAVQQRLYRSTENGAAWLYRGHRPGGRFLPGYVGALMTPAQDDGYRVQAGAAFGMARAAEFLGDERMAAAARQTVQTLLLDTAPDSEGQNPRDSARASILSARLGTAGALVLAINECTSPSDSFLQHSEQLCAFIARKQESDGSLNGVDQGQESERDANACDSEAGQALYALMSSQRHRPATWKTDAVRRALTCYRARWRTHRSMALVPWSAAAYTEAYALTKERPFAEFVLEMNDWLCGLQYQQLDPVHPLWFGGFMDFANGQALTTEPRITAAYFAEGLAHAWRLARHSGDVARQQRYREALERALQFVCALQYSEDNTLHYADWYRPVLVGGFHGSQQDGNLSIDYAQHALCALTDYLAMSAV